LWLLHLVCTKFQADYSCWRISTTNCLSALTSELFHSLPEFVLNFAILGHPLAELYVTPNYLAMVSAKQV